jgi:RNA polymerase sigma-70 factor, ECF subfamily
VAEPHDHDLIDRCVAGDHPAFEALLRRYEKRLQASLWHVLGSEVDAQDICQEAFIQAYQSLGSFRKESSFYSWLYRIALNAAASAKRKRTIKTHSLGGLHADCELDPADLRVAAMPEQQLETSETLALVRRGLDRLTEEFRAALVLKEIDGLKYEEIAEALGCPVGTIRSRIHRARLELKEILSRLLKAELEPQRTA